MWYVWAFWLILAGAAASGLLYVGLMFARDRNARGARLVRRIAAMLCLPCFLAGVSFIAIGVYIGAQQPH